MITVTMFSVAGVLSSIVFLALAIKYCKINAVLSSMAWATSMTSWSVKAQGKDENNIYTGPNMNGEMMAYILVGQAVVLIILYGLVNIVRQ